MMLKSDFDLIKLAEEVAMSAMRLWREFFVFPQCAKNLLPINSYLWLEENYPSPLPETIAMAEEGAIPSNEFLARAAREIAVLKENPNYKASSEKYWERHEPSGGAIRAGDYIIGCAGKFLDLFAEAICISIAYFSGIINLGSVQEFCRLSPKNTFIIPLLEELKKSGFDQQNC